jgi:hypothetical protein
MKRSALHCMAAGLGLAALAGCAAPYAPGPTTTTTTVVRDANGNPIAAGTTTRDSYGNAITSTPLGTYQSGPSYPAYPAPLYQGY